MEFKNSLIEQFLIILLLDFFIRKCNLNRVIQNVFFWLWFEFMNIIYENGVYLFLNFPPISMVAPLILFYVAWLATLNNQIISHPNLETEPRNFVNQLRERIFSTFTHFTYFFPTKKKKQFFLIRMKEIT